MWLLFSSQQASLTSLCAESFCPFAQKPILRAQSQSDPHYSVFKIHFNLILPLMLSVQKLCNYIYRFSHACSHPSYLTIFLFVRPNIDHSSTHDLWAEVVSIVPTLPAVSTVQCGFYWRVRGRSVSHARPDLTHPSATSPLTPNTVVSN